MAFNPDPKVAEAREFGNRFGADQVIFLYVNSETGQLGYASWGKTKGKCGMAKFWADIAFDAIMAESRD